MISHRDEYGADLDIEGIRARIEEALEITFVAHDSSFWNGLYYLWEDDGGQSIRIADNREGEPEGILYPMHLPAVTVVLTEVVEPSTWIRERLAAVDGLDLRTSARHDSSIVRPTSGYDTYGSPSLDPGPLAARVGALLGITFAPLVEEFQPGECYQVDGERENIEILDNRVEVPDRYLASRPDLKSIMEIYGTSRSAELHDLLGGVGGLVHLHHAEH